MDLQHIISNNFRGPYQGSTMKISFLVSIFVLYANAQFNNNLKLKFKGAGWIKSGRVMHSTDTITHGIDYNNSWLQDAGALFNGFVEFSENLEAGFGVGAVQKHKAQGKPSLVDINFKIDINNFITQSWISYWIGEKDSPRLKITAGLFPYKYDNNIKNLGLYLVRGPVYPGVLISGFEAKEMLQTGNTVGLQLSSHIGSSFSHDFIIRSEQDFAPLFDFSLMYVATYKPTPMFELGAGVNFYRWIPVRPGATSPSEDDFDPNGTENRDINNNYVIALDDTTSIVINDWYNFAIPDTVKDANGAPVLDINGEPLVNFTWIPHKGIKLMGRFVVTPPVPEFLGKDAFKLYGEAGVIGVQDYPGAYDDITERIPVMFGLYLPTFAGFFENKFGTNLIDLISLEMEWYGAKYLPDYQQLIVNGRTVPASNYLGRSRIEDVYDGMADDWKWSLYFAKVIAGHVKISGQFARDHFRTGGTTPTPAQNEILTAKEDWYWMLKLSYFF